MANLGAMNLGYSDMHAKVARNTAVQKRSSEIGGVCERLEKWISESSGLISALEDKLIPVLSAPQPTAETAGRTQSADSSPLANMLQEYTQRMENINCRLNALLNRLDL